MRSRAMAFTVSTLLKPCFFRFFAISLILP